MKIVKLLLLLLLVDLFSRPVNKSTKMKTEPLTAKSRPYLWRVILCYCFPYLTNVSELFKHQQWPCEQTEATAKYVFSIYFWPSQIRSRLRISYSITFVSNQNTTKGTYLLISLLRNLVYKLLLFPSYLFILVFL